MVLDSMLKQTAHRGLGWKNILCKNLTPTLDKSLPFPILTIPHAIVLRWICTFPGYTHRVGHRTERVMERRVVEVRTQCMRSQLATSRCRLTGPAIAHSPVLMATSRASCSVLSWRVDHLNIFRTFSVVAVESIGWRIEAGSSRVANCKSWKCKIFLRKFRVILTIHRFNNLIPKSSSRFNTQSGAITETEHVHLSGVETLCDQC